MAVEQTRGNVFRSKLEVMVKYEINASEEQVTRSPPCRSLFQRIAISWQSI